MGCGSSTPAQGQQPESAPAGQNNQQAGGNHRGRDSPRSAAGNGSTRPKVEPPKPPSSERRGFRSQLIQKSNRAWYDQYTKVSTLGQGMTGKVYCIKHKETGERYALKTMDASKVSRELLQDLVNEIELLQTLDHPNVIKLHEYFFDGDTVLESSNLYLVMELCEGGELFDRLHAQEGSHYSEARAAHIVSMMLSSIAYIHNRGITHRDLKLENFLFESRADDSNLKLIDFGLSARYQPRFKRMTTMVGTPYYIAPEILQGDKRGYTSACDMWSLGVITYMLLSGTPPFKGRHDADVLTSVRRGKYTLSGRRWEHVSDHAKNFVRKLLVYNATKRISATDGLKDPWIVRHARARARKSPESKDLNPEIVSNLRAFTQFSALKRAALEAIAFQVAAPKLANLREVFLQMDEDRTGHISLHEMQRVLVSRAGMDEGEVEQIFSRLDQDEQKTISYSEFLAATLSKRFYMREGRIRAAFQKLDIDNSGYITADNLKDMLGDDFTPKRVQEMIAEADIGGDGRIDYQEFLGLFREQAGASASVLSGPTSDETTPGGSRKGRRAYFDEVGLGDGFASVDEGGSIVLEGGPDRGSGSAASTPALSMPTVQEGDDESTMSGGAAHGVMGAPIVAPSTATAAGAEYYSNSPGKQSGSRPPPAADAYGEMDDAYAYLAADPAMGGRYTGAHAADDIHLYVGDYAEDADDAAREARRAARRQKRREERHAAKKAAQQAAAAQQSAAAANGSSEESESDDEGSSQERRDQGSSRHTRGHRDHRRARRYADEYDTPTAGQRSPQDAEGSGRKGRRGKASAVGGSVIVMSAPQKARVETRTRRSKRT